MFLIVSVSEGIHIFAFAHDVAQLSADEASLANLRRVIIIVPVPPTAGFIDLPIMRSVVHAGRCERR